MMSSEVPEKGQNYDDEQLNETANALQEDCEGNETADRAVVAQFGMEVLLVAVLEVEQLGRFIKQRFQNGQVLAVKKLNASTLGKAAVAARSFVNEVTALIEIRHRNIVRFYGFCLHESITSWCTSLSKEEAWLMF
ncbi:cysteine-rich receptor-like protein kinase 4 [Chenopodium quinoa]|uniref:cysteine-rich receptor-like protein kinase 4 n=1 Tax=Chenopodium quinoa TaxID=63459 RepID=UPI000B7985B8|nr:cysteine-rich receptor-like protein kinase 4 [Chenopodium quinoa]XP_021729954.1 cysteine-rich receptor-like protein kinase 4 [Chenopodium quinoa]XP_021729955.1 cysteine-rich receptor-like protein kinase 4 [Chenopodium quinoa]